MTDADRLDLARKLMRASLGLPREHTAHKAIDEAVQALMAKPVSTTTPPKAAA